MKLQRSTPRLFKKTTLIYAVTIRESSPDDRERQGYIKVNWETTEMFDLKTFKEAIVLYGMLSPFVKQILKSQAPQKRIIPKD